MAISLPIFPELPKLAVQHAPARDRNSDCTLCKHHANARNRCLPAEVSAGGSGGILVVGDYPGTKEDAQGRPFLSKPARYVRSLLQRHARQHRVGYTYALSCRAGGSIRVLESHLKHCRGYLLATIEEMAPDRIICVGAQAAKSIVGTGIPALSARRGYGWVTSPKLAPVFFLPHPLSASLNRFIRRWFEEDLQWALNVDVGGLKQKLQWDAFVNVVRTEDDGWDALDAAVDAGSVSYDAETVGRFFDHGETAKLGVPFTVLCVSIAPRGKDEVWLWDREALANPKLKKWLGAILADESVKKNGQNEKYDRHSMAQIGLPVNGLGMDTRLVNKLHFADADARLEVMQALVGMTGGKEEMGEALAEAIKTCRKKPIKSMPDRGSDRWLRGEFPDSFKFSLAKAVRDGDSPKTYAYGLVDDNLLHRYNAIDTLSTELLAEELEERARNEPAELSSVWDMLGKPLSIAITQMETWGVYVDQNAVNYFQTWVLSKTTEARQRIEVVAAKQGMQDFNPESTSHIASLLYDHLKLRCVKFTASGQRSTAVEALKLLSEEHPVVEDILTFRTFTKQRGTYADPIEAHIRSDGRVHPSVLVDGTRSGRPSCKEPNLFNIPRSSTSHGKMARDCYSVEYADLPAEEGGREMWSFDYSQLELRVACMESGDPVMRELFESGVDFHSGTAAAVFNEPIEVVSKGGEKEHLRSASKAINFGTLYGQGPNALAASIGCHPNEAKKMQEQILGKFKQLKRYKDYQLAFARKHGYVWTRWGDKNFRRRPLWQVADEVKFNSGSNAGKAKSTAENGTLNTPIQGKASDFCLFSIVAIVNWILENGYEEQIKLVLTVYDSIMLDAEKRMRQVILDNVPQLMLQWPTEGVPLVVDAEAGPAWGSMTKVGEFSNQGAPKLVQAG